MSHDTCRWVRARLPLLAGDDLLGTERRRAERHLIGCRDCRRHLESLRSAVVALRSAAAAEPAPELTRAPGLWAELERQIHESRRAVALAWPRLLAWSAAAALALSATLGVLAARRDRARPPEAPPVARTRPAPAIPAPVAVPASAEAVAAADPAPAPDRAPVDPERERPAAPAPADSGAHLTH